MTTLADDLVPDELWAIVEPLLPAPPRPPYGGRHRTISDRACLAAIVYMARTSTPWRLLPARELGCGSPATCWRRLTEWANAGVFDQLHLQVLDRLGQRGQLDWSQVSVDTMSVRAKRGGTTWAQIQSIVASLEASSTWPATPGLPLTAVVTAANVNDTTMFEAVVDDLPPVRTPAGRRRGIRPRIARRGIESSTRMGRHRWKVERALSWLSYWRRLEVRWDRDAGRWFAFALVACALVCFNRL